jgi:hypothetical protein
MNHEARQVIFVINDDHIYEHGDQGVDRSCGTQLPKGLGRGGTGYSAIATDVTPMLHYRNYRFWRVIVESKGESDES